MSRKPQIVLVTGATAGIGRHAALHLAHRGHHVIATGRNVEALAELRAAPTAGRTDGVLLDVTEPASIARAVAEVDAPTAGHGIDVLVNNAGYGQPGPLEEVGDAELRAQFETNVFGLVAVTRAFLPAMRARGAGRIVNVGSIGGRVTFPLFGAYHASKYAVEALSDALRRELAPFGVRVVVIEPGPIRTGFSDRALRNTHAVERPGSPWAAVYARAAAIEVSDRQAAGPEATSRAIEKAVERRRPRARYVVPFSSRLLLALVALLPTRVADALMATAVGLTPRGLRRGPAAAPAILTERAGG